MHLSLYEQGEIFRCAFLYGVCLGIYYEIFRMLRAVGFSSGKAVFLQDIVFSCSCSVLCFLFAQTTVHGRFRLFVITAHILGFAAYRCSVGVVTGRIFRTVGRLYACLDDTLNALVCGAVKKYRRFVQKKNAERRKKHRETAK